MTLTNEQVASLDEGSVLRVVRGHGLLGTEGTLVRYRPEVWHARRLQRDYVPAQTLDGLRIDESWYPDRFNLVEPQAITDHLPTGTLLRCVNVDDWDELNLDAFYRVLGYDNQFIQVTDLNNQPVMANGGSVPFGFYTRRFVYYPDSAPAEPTTEKGTTMSNTTTTTVPLTHAIASTLPIGSVVVRKADEDYKPGERFTLDKAGIDVDGDFHGTYDGETYGSYQRWTFFDLPDTLGTPEPTPAEGTATELQSLRVQRDAYKADLERVIDALREEAKDREWCSEYDRFMERLGFEARCTRKFTVRRRAYIEWDVEIEASDEDDAREQAEDNNPSHVRDLDSDYIDLESIEIVDVEEA